ncbi:hypothetical protein GOC74_05375 [Halomicrobium mukohataei]|uniref:Uncharacterized protein n=1 Tax=Halomicrobium mukohataei TaxID=57705 RepID=A0A847U8P3_9EURY|nr:hypothetical protein [Halomicrobium mukohataei]NLV09359.1 hypothetical protein [Halomicrobium mukohataei]
MATFTEAPTGAAARSLSDSDESRTATAASAATSSRSRPDTHHTVTQSGAVTADTVRPRPERPGDAAGAATTDTVRPRPHRRRDRAASTDQSAILIPAAFRPVAVEVVDPDGNPLPEVEWVMSAGVFPTAAAIDDDAQGDLPCLSTTYTTFMGVARRSGGPDGVRYTWFNPATDEDGNPLQDPIGPLDDTATIVLDPVKLKGLSVGRGGNLGGPLS